MNRNILNQALVTMGYRRMDTENVYGKPVGYCLILARIDIKNEIVRFETWFQNMKNEPYIYSSAEMKLGINDIELTRKNEVSEKEIYEYYINEIAYSELTAKVENAMQPNASCKVWAFWTKIDIANYEIQN